MAEVSDVMRVLGVNKQSLSLLQSVTQLALEPVSGLRRCRNLVENIYFVRLPKITLVCSVPGDPSCPRAKRGSSTVSFC